MYCILEMWTPLLIRLPFSILFLIKMPDVVTIWRQGLVFGLQKDFSRANLIQSNTASTWATWTTSRYSWQLDYFSPDMNSSCLLWKLKSNLMLLSNAPGNWFFFHSIHVCWEKRRMCQQEKWNSQLWISFIWQPSFLIIPWFLFKPNWFTTDRASQVMMNSIKYEIISVIFEELFQFFVLDLGEKWISQP